MKTEEGIYKLERDTLEICCDRTRPLAFTTKGAGTTCSLFRLQRVLPQEIRHVDAVAALEQQHATLTIDAHGNVLYVFLVRSDATDDDIRCIGDLTELEVLSLSGNHKITDIGLAGILNRLPNLKTIFLINTKIHEKKLEAYYPTVSFVGNRALLARIQYEQEMGLRPIILAPIPLNKEPRKTPSVQSSSDDRQWDGTDIRQ